MHFFNELLTPPLTHPHYFNFLRPLSHPLLSSFTPSALRLLFSSSPPLKSFDCANRVHLFLAAELSFKFNLSLFLFYTQTRKIAAQLSTPWLNGGLSSAWKQTQNGVGATCSTAGVLLADRVAFCATAHLSTPPLCFHSFPSPGVWAAVYLHLTVSFFFNLHF